MTNNYKLPDMSEIECTPKKRGEKVPLSRFYDSSQQRYELSIDEAGRGCLFGRVYIACVVLPKDPEQFSGKDIKDSKKFTSKKKLNDAAEYIKQHALAWHVAYMDEKMIDDVNILSAVMRGMHDCIGETMRKVVAKTGCDHSLGDFMAVIDGNYFAPYIGYDKSAECMANIKHVTIEQGDAKYMAIAAASILAKTARDNYVLEMCEKYPELSLRYGLEKNMGYGTKLHLAGIQEHGITQWHRRTFGNACKSAVVNEISAL